MPELSAKARVSTDSCASLDGLFIVERGSIRFARSIRGNQRGTLLHSAPGIPAGEYPLQLVRDDACKCRHAGVVIPRHLPVMYGSRQPAPGRGLIVHARRVFVAYEAIDVRIEIFRHVICHPAVLIPPQGSKCSLAVGGKWAGRERY